MYISITLSTYINVSTAFGEKHNRLRDSRLSLVRPSGGLRLVADKTTKKKKIKPRVDYEPRLAHGRAVNKGFSRLVSTSCSGRLVFYVQTKDTPVMLIMSIVRFSKLIGYLAGLNSVLIV